MKMKGKDASKNISNVQSSSSRGSRSGVHDEAVGIFLIFWTDEGSREDIDENDEDHHDSNADV